MVMAPMSRARADAGGPPRARVGADDPPPASGRRVVAQGAPPRPARGPR
ncbi:alkene reductase, partial [Streptomyces sp. NPDC058953]